MTTPDSPGAAARTARRRPAATVLVAAALTLAASAVVAGPAWAEPRRATHATTSTGDDLDQTLDGDEPLVEDAAVLSVGHVDLGPRFVDGSWTFLVHDDAARADPGATSVWRRPAQAVLRVVDAARLTVPDDPAYAFLGAAPGTPVWVVPQTQASEVVWLGWNTQDPEVMARIDRGVTLRFSGVQGPGDVTVFLQSGTFGEPDVLWDSRDPAPQDVWVDVNTHTHANWVFTQPGVYLLEVTASATLLDGTQASDTQVLRVAVGTDTSTDEALATAWRGASGAAAGSGGGDGPEQDAGSAPPAPDGSAGAGGTGGIPATTLLAAAIGAAAVTLLTLVVAGAVRGGRTRRAVLAARAATSAPPAGPPEGPGSTGSTASTGSTGPEDRA